MSESLPLVFAEIDPERDGEVVAVFLSQYAWSFHARSSLTMDDTRQVKLGPSDQVRSFWVQENQSPAGIVRVFDLEGRG